MPIPRVGRRALVNLSKAGGVRWFGRRMGCPMLRAVKRAADDCSGCTVSAGRTCVVLNAAPNAPGAPKIGTVCRRTSRLQ
jgi:hypothetical protein